MTESPTIHDIHRTIRTDASTDAGPADIPDHEAVAAFASALAGKRLSPWWFELMPYMSAYSGLHMGEIFALDLEHLDPHHDSRAISVEWKIIETGGQTIRVPAERRKHRTTIYPELTPTGYPLAAMMTRRAAEAATDKAAGRNPMGLLFPAPRGGYLRKSNFINRYAIPAYTAAGWRNDGDQTRWAWHDLRRLFCITALNEWGLDIADVSQLAGDIDVRATLGTYGEDNTMLTHALKATGPQ